MQPALDCWSSLKIPALRWEDQHLLADLKQTEAIYRGMNSSHLTWTWSQNEVTILITSDKIKNDLQLDFDFNSQP